MGADTSKSILEIILASSLSQSLLTGIIAIASSTIATRLNFKNRFIEKFLDNIVNSDQYKYLRDNVYQNIEVSYLKLIDCGDPVKFREILSTVSFDFSSEGLKNYYSALNIKAQKSIYLYIHISKHGIPKLKLFKKYLYSVELVHFLRKYMLINYSNISFTTQEERDYFIKIIFKIKESIKECVNIYEIAC